MNKELRDYQSQAIAILIEEIKKGERNLYIKSGTGSGKTFLTKKIIEEFKRVKPDLKVLFAVPKNILITQTIKEFGFDCGIYNAELGKRELHKDIVVGSIQSLVSQKVFPKFHLVIFDEVHRARSSHEKVLKRIRVENPKALLLGLTATDYNLNEKLGLKKICDFGLKMLTDKGYLAPLVIQEGDAKIDIDTLKTQGEGYRQKEVDEQLETKLERQVEDMIKKTVNRNKVIIMCTTIAHAKSVYRRLRGAHMYHSKLDKHEKNFNLEEWKSRGKYLVSVIAASEGFDFPPADCLVLFRPTRSPTLYEQACGRVARLHPSKKNGLILDYGGVIDSLGLPYNISVKKKGAPKDHKECKACGAVNPLDQIYCSCGNAFTYVCQGCQKVRVKGEKCCERVIDRFKNLTEKAHAGTNRFKPLKKITLHKHISRKGNECLKVVWWKDDFNVLVTEYFVFSNNDFKRFSDSIFKESPRNPMELYGKEPVNLPCEVLVEKVDGYNKVTSLKFY